MKLKSEAGEQRPLRDVPGLRAGRWNRLRAPLTGDARRLYIEAFARSVREHRPSEVDGIQGRRILEAVLAAYGSTQTTVSASRSAALPTIRSSPAASRS